MDNLHRPYAPQSASLELESVMQFLRSRDSARAAASEAEFAQLSAAPAVAFGALALAKLSHRDQFVQRNMPNTTSLLAQTNTSPLLGHTMPWLESTNTTNNMLSSLAHEAQLQRESALGRLSRLLPARPSFALPMQLPLVASKRPFESMALPPAHHLQSAYKESFSPATKRQRLEEHHQFEQRQLVQIQKKMALNPLSDGGPPPSRLAGLPKPKVLSMACDRDNLTPYQCLAREQIELFAAREQEVQAGTKGRNRSIVFGQVGIRCRHCAHLPQRARAKGSTIYPSKLSGIYQTGQNMALHHISEHCQEVPTKIRDDLKTLGNRKSSAGGGRDYWASGAKIMGVVEDNHGLRFNDESH